MAALLKKVLAFLRQGWVLSLLGIIALALIIWFAGPFFAFAGAEPLAGPVARLVTILVVFVLWGLNNLRSQVAAKKANSRLVDDLAPAADPDPIESGQSAAEVQVLRERFAEAMNILKRAAPSGKGRGTRVYDLPWYIMIGPPGSGKTTALVNSGLKFPLAERFGAGSIKGVGGTRNCDWWFTEDAVLLDTAGRYTLQEEGGGADAAAWEGFLDLLRRHRRRRPINGIIIAVSLSDLMQQTQYERDANAQAIRRRIQELVEKFAVSFPVYVLLTKADLVAGFMPCFDELGREERAQVWGVTFPLDAPGQLASQFESGYDGLLQRLGQRAMQRLQQERNVGRRGLILGFPQQMASLKPLIGDFLSKVFQESRYEQRALPRGVYFASGTQEGAPIDRVMAALGRTFGMGPQSAPIFGGHGRSFFLTRLFSEVIIPEAEIAGTNRAAERRGRILTAGAYAAAILVAVTAGLGLAIGYTRNDASIQRLDDSVTAYQTADGMARLAGPADFGKKLAALAALGKVREVYGDREDRIPLFSDFGLYVGNELGAATDRAYQRALQRDLFPHVQKSLEAQMLDRSRGTGPVYDALSLYMSLADPQKIDRSRLSRWMHAVWEHQYGRNAALRDQLRAHLDFMLAHELTLRPKLSSYHIESARRIVCSVSPAEQILRRIYERLDAREISPYKIDPAGRAAYRVFATGSRQSGATMVPGRFTRPAFDIFMRESLARISLMYGQVATACRLQVRLTPVVAGEIRERVIQLFLRDYTQSWDRLASGIRLVPFTDIAHGVKVLDALSGPESPLRDLMNAIERNTALGPKREGKAAALARAAGRPMPPTPGEMIERRYRPLHVMVRPVGDKPAPIEVLIADLRGLHDYMAGVAGAPDVGLAAVDAAKARFQRNGKDLLGRVRDESSRQVAPVRQVLMQASRNSWAAMLRRARMHMNDVWKDEVLPGYARIDGRFPLSKSSKLDARLTDFARFFRPNGIMDGFFSGYLKPFVISRGRWRARTIDGIGIGLDNATLAQFHRASRIKNALFRDGAQTPTVKFTIEPTSLDSRAGRFALTMDGQTSLYRHTPVRPQVMEWPGPARPGNARIQFVDRYGRQHSQREDGDWAWFRLLASARLRQTGSEDTLRAEFKLGGLTAIQRITTDSVLNPFTVTRELFRFRAPGAL